MAALSRRQLLAAAVGSAVPLDWAVAGHEHRVPAEPAWLTYNLDPAPGNLLSRDLQETQCGWMQGWQAGGSLKAYPQNERVHSNNDGFLLEAVGQGWGSCGPSPYLAGYQIRLADPVPASLTFSAYLSAAAPTRVLKLQLTFFTSANARIEAATSPALALTPVPRQLSLTAPVPVGAVFVQPEFLVENAVGDEVIFVDFVVVRPQPALPAPSVVTHNRSGAWTTVFFDDFETFDDTRWDKAPNNWTDPAGLGTYDAGLVSVADSILTLRGEQRGGEWYSSNIHGRLKGQRIRTGLIEWRAKLPRYAKGIHPALWLMPARSVYGWWPYSGEIDVLEYVGTEETPTVDGRQTFYSTLIFSDDGNLKKVSYPCNMRIDWDADWHVYQCLWERAIDGRHMVRFAVDDVPYGIIDQSQWVAPSGAPAGAPFEQEFYLICSMNIGGTWSGPPLPQASGSELQIDWVRVRQRS
jgi:beta-glucanase (GH16 family)